MERTVVLVKPDGIQRGLIGEVIHRFERKGLKLVALKMVPLGDDIIEAWYGHHKDKPFFPGLKAYMQEVPVIAMVWEGSGAIDTVRKMTGVTKSRDAEAGTIRGDFGMSQQYNLIHSSENQEASDKELGLIFTEDEIFDWNKKDSETIYLPDER